MAFVTAHLMGGLGNQLFQIATAYAYAKREHKSLVFRLTWPTRSDRPPLWNTYLDPSGWNISLPGPSVRISEKAFSFHELPSVDSEASVELYGYFQSSEYFSAYAEEIRDRLQINPSLKSLFPIPNNCIGAHVRRGDYMNHAAYHYVCSPKYYTGSRDYIDLEMPVFWITDDPEWVQENLYRPGDSVVSSDTIADFTRLSQFKHLILSNSSFSWWAAWLNPCGFVERKICCPNKWFGPTGPKDVESIYEPGWSRIDTTSGKVDAQV